MLAAVFPPLYQDGDSLRDAHDYLLTTVMREMQHQEQQRKQAIAFPFIIFVAFDMADAAAIRLGP